MGAERWTVIYTGLFSVRGKKAEREEEDRMVEGGPGLCFGLGKASEAEGRKESEPDIS